MAFLCDRISKSHEHGIFTDMAKTQWAVFMEDSKRYERDITAKDSS